MSVRRWIWNVLIAIDQLINTLLRGDPDETISSRLAHARDRGSRLGRIGCTILDRIDPEHCEESKE